MNDIKELSKEREREREGFSSHIMVVMIMGLQHACDKLDISGMVIILARCTCAWENSESVADASWY